MRSRTTTSELRNPGPGWPFASIQHSRGGGGTALATDVARVLGADEPSAESSDDAREV